MFDQTYTARKRQAAVAVHSRHPVTPRLRRNGPVCCWLASFAAYGTPSTMHCQWGWRNSFLFLSPVTLTFDLSPWHSNSSERGPNTSSLWIWCKSV